MNSATHFGAAPFEAADDREVAQAISASKRTPQQRAQAYTTTPRASQLPARSTSAEDAASTDSDWCRAGRWPGISASCSDESYEHAFLELTHRAIGNVPQRDRSKLYVKWASNTLVGYISEVDEYQKRWAAFKKMWGVPHDDGM